MNFKSPGFHNPRGPEPRMRVEPIVTAAASGAPGGGPCFKCNGSGKVDNKDNGPFGTRPSFSTFTPPSWPGTNSQDDNKETCPMCGGTGRRQ